MTLLLLASCVKESKEPTPAPPPAYSDAAKARRAVDSLSTLGVAKIYLSADDKAGLPLAWGAYLSGLVESEATEGYYPALHEQRLSAPNIMELSQWIYSTCLGAIELADHIEEALPSTKGLDASERERLLGEVRLHRAWARFYLIQTFGSYPEGKASRKLSLNDAYALVIRDLDGAIARLPQRGFEAGSPRPTAFVARALLGEVYIQMSGYPLQESRYRDAVSVLRPIIQSGVHRLATNGADAEHSAYNTLRTSKTDAEYLYAFRGEVQAPRTSFALPQRARGWENVKGRVLFNAFTPTSLLMSVYKEGDLRGQDRQLFHTFLKVSEEGKTVFEIFAPAPYLWLTNGAEAPAPKTQTIGVYRYAEVLLMMAESVVQTQGVTPEAVRYLSAVRTRATSEPLAEVEQALSALTAERFLEEVYLERLRELPLEMKQLSDVVRTRLYPVLQDGAIALRPLEGARTPQGRRLSPSALVLPLPAL